MVAFYNQGDQAIYQGGQHFIPQEQYRLNYIPPTTEEDQTTTSGTGVGIPYTNAFTGSGGNFDTSIRTPKNYRRTQGSYVPGSIGLPGNVPQKGPGRDWSTEYEVTRPLDTDLINKYREYNPGKYEKYTDRQMYDIGLKGLDANNLSYMSTSPMTPGDDEKEGWRGTLDKAMQWGMTAAGIPVGFLSKMGGAINQMLPTNRRAIMENEMLGSGFTIDSNGRIVSTGGDPDDPSGLNIFANYNAAQMDEDTFDDRIKSLGKMSVEGRRKRTAAILAAKKRWLDSQGTTDAIIDKKEMDKKMKAYEGPKTVGYDESGPTQQDIRDTRPDKSGADHGGFTNPGEDSYGPHKKMADGGRIGFEEGGRNFMGDYDPQNTTGWQESGQVETWNPGGGGTTTTSFKGDGNNQGNTGGITQLVDTDLMRTDPNVEINYDFKKLPLYLQAKLHNKNLLTEDNINLEGQLTGGNSLIDYGINFTDEGFTGGNVGIGPMRAHIDPNKNIDLGYTGNIGGYDINARTNLQDAASLSASKNGWDIGLTHNPEGTNAMVNWSTQFGQPKQPVNALSYDDLIYGQNLRYGGLAGIL